MALSTESLTTYQTARDFIGLGHDDANAAQSHIERIINAVSEAMSKEACRPFARATVTAERHGSNSTPRLVLKRTPIVSVSAVTYIGPDGSTVYETVPSSVYYIEDSLAGFLTKSSLWTPTSFLPSGVGDANMLLPDSPERRIAVTYIGGWITPEQARQDALLVPPVGLVRNLPYDLEEACLASVASVWRRSGQDRNVASENSQTVGKTWRDSSNLLTSETLRTCARYARWT